MSRQARYAALLAVLFLGVPAASACPPIFFRPYYYYPPAAMMPAPYYVPPPYYYVPPPAPTARPPQVQVEPSKPTEFAKPESAKPPATSPKQSTDTGVKPAEFRTPDSIPLAQPRPVTPETAVPKPAIPEFKLDPPAGGVPKADVPQIPAPGSAAKEPDGVKIPPLVPPLKGVPDPTVPPLAIPTPTVDNRSSTSKSSPLTDRPRVEVVPAEGMLRDPLGRRSVGFFNQSDRDVRLTVEGQTITLPRRHTVTASVPATFAWKLDDGPVEKTTIPGAAPGVEVLIRR